MHKKDRALLESVQVSLGGVGKIHKHGEQSIQYRVDSLQELTKVVVPYFDKYPLLNKKRGDF
jgi:hypothetical protein